MGSSQSFDVCVINQINVPAAKAWEVFREFGPGCLKWWKQAASVELEGQAAEAVGCIRVYHSITKTVYRERLEVLDDQQRLLEYSLVESNPPVPVKGVRTAIQFNKIDDKSCEVRWSAKIDWMQAPIPMVKSMLGKIYHQGIMDLEHYFEKLKWPKKIQLKVIAARNLDYHDKHQPNSFVLLESESLHPQATQIEVGTCHPHWDESFEYPWENKPLQVSMNLYSVRGTQNDLLGKCLLSIDKFPEENKVI